MPQEGGPLGKTAARRSGPRRMGAEIKRVKLGSVRCAYRYWDDLNSWESPRKLARRGRAKKRHRG